MQNHDTVYIFPGENIMANSIDIYKYSDRELFIEKEYSKSLFISMKEMENRGFDVAEYNISCKIAIDKTENKYFVFKVSREIKNYKFNIYTLKNITQENKIYKRLEYLVILFTIIGVVITIIVSKIMSRRILKPINNVIKTAKSISTDDLSKRIEIPKEEDELQNLTLIINEMLDRLETSFENQTKFVSDASHELRTPLAIIKGYAEIIRKRGTADIDIFVESIDSIISETDNMRNLIQKLLFLAKGEITKINTKFVEIDANEMVRQIYLDTKVSTKTHEIHLKEGENFKINGDETLLQQAIRAIIENATKYSEENTNIYIESEIRNGNGVISIRDEGVGISKEDTKRIFDRFYRVDLSRTKATGGTGLGLAIVKRIIEIHNGKIEIDSEMGKGTKISIVLPIKSSISLIISLLSTINLSNSVPFEITVACTFEINFPSSSFPKVLVYPEFPSILPLASLIFINFPLPFHIQYHSQ